MNQTSEGQVQRVDHPKRNIHLGWILAIVIPLLIVIAGLYAFSKFLYGVEYYSPTVTLEKYVDMIKTKDYTGAVNYIGLKENTFNSLGDYTTYFQNYYGDSVESYVFTERKLQRTEDSVFYDVRINKKDAQKFKLTKTGEKKLFLFDTWKVEMVQAIPTKTVAIQTPPGVALNLNGVAVTNDYKLATPTYSLDFYKNIKDDFKNLSVESYEIKDIVAISSIDAKTAAGDACEVVLQTDKDGIVTYIVKLPLPKTQEAEIKARTEVITKKYAEFVAKDVVFSALTPYLYKNTKLYDDLKEFYNGWFTPHTSYGFENVNFFDMQSFDDTHCAVGIEFNYFVYKFGKRFDYHVKYNVYLIKVEKSWLLADLSIQ